MLCEVAAKGLDKEITDVQQRIQWLRKKKRETTHDNETYRTAVEQEEKKLKALQVGGERGTDGEKKQRGKEVSNSHPARQGHIYTYDICTIPKCSKNIRTHLETPCYHCFRVLLRPCASRSRRR